MKKNLLRILLVLIICSCSTTKSATNSQVNYSKFTNEELDAKIKSLKKKQNNLIAQKYLKLSKQRNSMIPLGLYGWKEVKEYWNLVPELKAYRDDFEASDERLKNFLIDNDDRYPQAIESYKQKEISAKEFKYIKKSVFKKMKEYHPNKYKKLRNDRDNLLKTSNLKTLEYIISDHQQKEKIFPVAWIPGKTLSQIKKNKAIKDISEEIRIIKNIQQKK